MLLDDRQIKVGSADEFQGGQSNVVIISLARSDFGSGCSATNSSFKLGFLRNPERANVVTSRARYLCIIVGSVSHFQNGDADFWRHLIAMAKVV